MIRFLYESKLGRIILKPFITKGFAEFMRFLCDSPVSRLIIKHYIYNNNINMDDYENKKFKSFNDFFTRKIKEGKREFNQASANLVSPSDGFATTFNISENGILNIKGLNYTISSLLRDEDLAAEFYGGTCIIIRLTPNNYHRYSYVDNGFKGENIHIDGVFHCVRPYAVSLFPVYAENSREYTVINTENFGKIIQMEVGAMSIGRIKNYHQSCYVKRGIEKGYFEFGGSSIVLIIQQHKVKVIEEIRNKTNNNDEFPVLMGQIIGTKI